VNIGLLASVGRIFYVRPHLRRDVAAITSAVAAATAIIAVEGVASVRFCPTPQGREQQKKMKKQGATVMHHLHEQIMRPGILGGMIGLGNSHFYALVKSTLSHILSERFCPWDHRVYLLRQLE